MAHRPHESNVKAFERHGGKKRVTYSLMCQQASRNNNRHLNQAQRNPGIAPHPDLFWWEVNGVGAFYAYDGTDLVVVLMARVANPPTYGALLSMAQGRM
jgi:hypothetical protein